MIRRLPLLALLPIGLAAPLPGQAGDQASLIREARARSNRAIAAHDVPGILAEIDETFQVTAGSGRLIRGREAMEEAFREQFGAFPDAVYVRSIDTIDVAEDEMRAFESGSWEGTWTTPEGPYRVGGSYSASWIRAGDTWKIRAELFVTLFCEGRSCA